MLEDCRSSDTCIVSHWFYKKVSSGKGVEKGKGNKNLRRRVRRSDIRSDDKMEPVSLVREEEIE